MYVGVNEFQVSVNDRIFSGNEQQKVYYNMQIFNNSYRLSSRLRICVNEATDCFLAIKRLKICK